MNCVPSRQGRKPTGSYKVLSPTLEMGKRIPIFFTGDLSNQNTLEIGLTRLFKIGHDYAVGDKLDQEKGHKLDPEKPDMVEALFGHVFEDTDLPLGVTTTSANAPEAPTKRQLARKGRIAFGFATLLKPEDAITNGGDVTALMMGPRASFAPFYLKGQFKDWSDPAARLAGRKRYFPRFADQQQLANAPASIADKLRHPRSEMTSTLRFLEPKYGGETLNFVGTIRLHNVLPEEVGALLWALTLSGDPQKPYRHLIGRAKNAGAGQVRVKAVTLNLERNDGKQVAKAESGTWEVPGVGNEGWTIAGAQSLTPYLAAFLNHMRGNTPGRAWPRVPEIQELLGCSTPGFVPVDSASYPGLPEFSAVRNTTKHHQRQVPPAAAADDRYLETPAVEADSIVTPYE
jgi:CRISPR-associated protein (TIGR03986 family)